MTPKIGDILSGTTITSVANTGAAVAKYGDKPIFIDAGAIGDQVELRITELKSGYIRAEITAVESPSDDRVIPFCKHYGSCGGCHWQHVRYEQQLAYKRDYTDETLKRISGVILPPLALPEAATSTRFYRNKLSFSFSNNCWDGISKHSRKNRTPGIGFHADAAVVAIDSCHLQSELSNQIINYTRDIAIALGLSFYDHDKCRGLLRDLIIRNTASGEIMLILHVGYVSPASGQLLDALCAKFDAIASSYIVVNTDKHNQLLHLPFEQHSGNECLVDKLGQLHYRVSPKAFYQTNTEQTERLYNRIADYADLRGIEIVYDLFCGTGTIGLWLAKDAAKVIGVESVVDAVTDARENAKLNTIKNADFISASAERALGKHFIKKYGKADVIIVDPPRAGLAPELIDKINSLRPQKLIYVSCDAATQARDFKRLDSHFEVSKLSAIDMFPHTYHVETVALLIPRKQPRKIAKKQLIRY